MDRGISLLQENRETPMATFSDKGMLATTLFPGLEFSLEEIFAED